MLGRVFGEAKEVVSVDVSNQAITKVVKLRLEGKKYRLEAFEYHTEEGNAETSLAAAKSVCVILGDSHAVAFAVEEFTTETFELQVRKFSLDLERQIVDYVGVDDGAIVAAVEKTTADEVVSGVSTIFPVLKKLSVGHVAVSLVYLYRFESRQEKALIACFCGDYLTICVVHNGMPLWISSFEVCRTELSDLAKIIIEKAGRPDRVLLCGDCSEKEAEQMRALAKVEYFSALSYLPIKTDKLNEEAFSHLEQQAHRLTVAIASAAMMLDCVGINLSTTDWVASKELPRRLENTLSVVADDVSSSYKQRRFSVFLQALSALQTNAIVIAVFVALLVVGYHGVVLYQEEELLRQQELVEENRAKRLAEVRSLHNSYRAQLEDLKAKLSIIEQIGRNQLTVRKVLYELSYRVPEGVFFKELYIENTDVKLKGYALDRSAVVALANRLGQSVGTFANVIPVYDDKNSPGQYEIACKYVGEVPLTPLVKIKEVIGEVR
ncbi:MAG: PilN domain-containing protein [Acidobacteriota bacterium]|nr:PilN domain-containing protein [Blastocatellia bacterium]MDW8411679.1 PilN domain-containing protein [Acidobacteriota bacterium]